jgi:GTPase SAR1 family protein/Ca2+-binding EF-hand superfamily protein
MDLFRPASSSSAASTSSGNTTADDQALARKRQQIVSLMQRFPFVRQCIKCSAKNLLRVDDVFLKAQQAVLYPFVPPLYDLKTGQLTIACKRALTRIFRMFDRDNDGLLADAELDRFQRDTFTIPVFDKDLAAWKKVVTRNNPSEMEESVLVDGKFTVQGFMTIFDVFISQNRLDVVWQALRKFNYDDDLNLHIPDSVLLDESAKSGAIMSAPWKLSNAAKQFLTRLFIQFDSDKDGFISPDDIIAIFAVLPPPALPPWHPMRAPELFEGCFSVPKETPSTGSSSGSDSPDYGGDASLIVPSSTIGLQQSLYSTSGVSILSASDSLPSVDVGGMHPLPKSISFLAWMGHWHAISAISPSVTRSELYRLGHVEDYSRHSRHTTEGYSRRSQPFRSRKKKASDEVESSTGIGNAVYNDTRLKSREIRVLVLGSRGCGKTAFLNSVLGSMDGAPGAETTRTTRAQTSSTFIKLKRSFGLLSDCDAVDGREGEEVVVHFVFTDVPESAASRQKEHYRQLSELFGSTATPKESVCDLAVLVYDCTDLASLTVAKDLEAKLVSKETPRVFVGAKSDLVVAEPSDKRSTAVLEDAVEHCRLSDLEPPLLTSAMETNISTQEEDRFKTLNHLARCALAGEPGIQGLRSRPHEAEKRREAARRRKMMWFGGIVSMGVVVVVGVGLLWSGSAKKDQKGGFCWLRSLFGGGTRSSKGIPVSS